MIPPVTIDADLIDEAPDDDAEAASVAVPPAVEHFHFDASKTQTQRIDQFLTSRVGHLSRAAVQRLIDDGRVTVNGKVTKASYKLKGGDAVDMMAPPEVVHELVPEDIPLDIIYEDDHLLALNKQADLVVHPARGRWTGTLVNGLVFYGKKWSTLNGDWRPGILHRLDRNTTGIMLVAKSDEAHWRVARQFENRTIRKSYVAVVHGVPELAGDAIDMPIGKDKYIREKQAVRKEDNGGRPATTAYQVGETFAHAADAVLHPSGFANDRKLPPPPERFAFVNLSPKTGRTHQLRVHMTAIGHPMVGDTMYGGRTFESAPDADGNTWRFARQALHAAQITFVHPVTLQTMTLAAPLPPDLTELMARLRGRGDL
jgi:23S rRNA pseudouridine1911/1915/1917 synthase